MKNTNVVIVAGPGTAAIVRARTHDNFLLVEGGWRAVPATEARH